VEDARVEASPGGRVEVGTIRRATLAVSRLDLSNVSLQSLPLRALEAIIGHRLEGILGNDLFMAVVLQFDWDSGVVRFEDPEAFRGPEAAVQIPVRLAESAAYVKVDVVRAGGGAVTGEFKLDTGSVDVAGLNNNFAEQNKLAPLEARIPSSGVAVGGDTKGYLFRAAGLRWPGLVVRAPLLGVTTDSGGFENRPDAGTLGAGFLSCFRVTFDYRRRRLLVEAPRGKAPLAPSDSSGLWVVADGERLAGRAVKRVLAHSPAAEAGFRPGDQLLEVGGLSAEALTLSRLRDLLLVPGHEYDVLLKGPRRVRLRTRSYPSRR
jgi:hypothetical protein